MNASIEDLNNNTKQEIGNILKYSCSGEPYYMKPRKLHMSSQVNIKTNTLNSMLNDKKSDEIHQNSFSIPHNWLKRRNDNVCW